MYLYTTPTFDEQASRYGLDHSVSKLREKLKEYHVRYLMDPVGPYYKKREGKLRLIADVQRVNDQEVVCLLKVIERKSGDYDRFLDNPDQFGERYLQPLLDVAALEAFVNNAESTEPVGREPLPDELRLWFEPPEWGSEMEAEDIVFFESWEWVRRFKRPEIHKYWQTYQSILDVVANPKGKAKSEQINGWPGLELYGDGGRFVLYAHAEVRGELVEASRSAVFLIAPFTARPTSEEIHELAAAIGLFEEGAIFEDGKIVISPDKLAQCARRSYPGYLIAGEEEWFAIEMEEEANLALSAEEELVLKSVSRPAAGHPSLPIFINGRAGSGKSTMLLRLFADYCYRKLRHGLSGEPLFLTYNERLLEVARGAVTRLLRSHYRFVHDKEIGQLAEPGIASYFRPFQKFLISLLPPDEQPNFRAENYISFHRFKSLYSDRLRRRQQVGGADREVSSGDRTLVLKLPEAERWSPEICWYIIRTFIKGYLADGFMSAEDYSDDVPRRDRIVPEEIFNDIHNTIWKQWYLPLTTEKGCWDDQDLVRRVLELGCVSSTFTAVFCDEAQDFTRLELRLVMQLSLFSRFDLGYTPIRSLPFAFAGDPLQTLNPTGFSWTSVRSAFYEEVISVLDPSQNWELDMNFRTLSFNYRSAPPIVRVTNLVQLWRHTLFGLQDVEPQKSWQTEEAPDPLKFILSHNLNPDDLKQAIENTIIIVPCEEGEEISFIEKDPTLAGLFKDVQLEEPPKNVLSAIAAKGLEFKRVILYNFGHKCDESVWSLLDRTEDRRPIEHEYFFNKLYVAASRAMERLFIIDSEVGEEKLWKRANSETDAEPFLQKLKNRTAWNDAIQTIRLGTFEDIQGMREEDPLFNAQQFESKGLSLQNPKLLRRAKQFYRTVGHDAEAVRCEAEALKLEEDYASASRLFGQLGRIDDAGNCLWRGMLWQELVDWSQANPEAMKQEVSIGAFMVAGGRDAHALRRFADLLVDVMGDNDAAIKRSSQWRAAIATYAARLTGLDQSALTVDEWQRAGSALEELCEFGYSDALSTAAQCFYRGRSLQRAVECWQKCNADPREYYLAKSKIDAPNSLMWLERAEAYEEIVDQWIEAGGLTSGTDKPWSRYLESALEKTNKQQLILDEWEKAGATEANLPLHWLRIIGPALRDADRFWEAAQVCVQLDKADEVKECLVKAKPGGLAGQVWQEVKHLVDYFMRKRDRGFAIEIVSKYFDTVDDFRDEKLEACCGILNKFTESDETPESLSPYLKDQYQRLVRRVLAQQESQWSRFTALPRMGKALEKTGDYDEVLKFYEGIIDGANASLGLSAKRRWIRNRQKQEEQYERAGNEFMVVQVHADIEKRARAWNISLRETISFYPPLDTGDRDEPQPERIVGLPGGTAVEELVDGVFRFRLGRIEVTVHAANSFVNLQDLDSFHDVRLDGTTGEIEDHTGSVSQERENGETRFESKLGFGGRILVGTEPKRIEIKVSGIQDVITISL